MTAILIKELKFHQKTQFSVEITYKIYIKNLKEIKNAEKSRTDDCR